MSVASRWKRGPALLNITDNKHAFFCIHEKSPIIYWLGLTLCFSDIRLPSNSHYQENGTLIKGNNMPLVSAVRKYEEASAWSRGTHDSVVKRAPPPLYSLLSLAWALPRCWSFLWPLGGGRVAAEQQSQIDHQEISRKLNSDMCCSLGTCVGCTVGSLGRCGWLERDTQAFQSPTPKPCSWVVNLSQRYVSVDDGIPLFVLPTPHVLGCYRLPPRYVSLLFKTKGNKAINCVVCRKYGHSVWEML